MILKEPAGMKMALGENPRRVYGSQKRIPSTRMGNAAVLRAALVDAQNYLAKWEGYQADLVEYEQAAPDERGKKPRPPERDLKLEALGHASWWAKQRKLDLEEELTKTNEMEFIALARVLIFQNQQEEAIGLLQSMLRTEEAMGRTDRVIEILILLALAYQDLENIKQSLSTLSKVLLLAEPRGFLHIFVDEGPPMARLLYESLTHGIKEDYIRELLAAFPVVDPVEVDPRGKDGELIEPLSDREIEVLQLIADGCTSREIAARLYLSPNTIKVHTRNINGKLGVNNRMKAVAKAKTLGILPSM